MQMLMKYSINFIPDKCRGKEDEGNLRMIVQWSEGGRCSLSVKHRVNLTRWSKDAQRCKPNTMHGSYTASIINKCIQRYEDAATAVLTSYETPPRADEVKDAILDKLGLGRKIKTEERNLRKDVNTFVIEQSKQRSWSDRTAQNIIHVYTSLKQLLKRDPTYADIDSEEAQGRLIELYSEAGLKSSSIASYLKKVNWFLRWADKKGIGRRVQDTPGIKTAQKKVIYLTREELMKIYHAELDNYSQRRCRDLLCLSCFTGLRYSDVSALTKSNLKGDTLQLTSRKDTDNLVIELNDYSKAILQRIELSDEEREKGCITPRIDISHVNRSVKDIAKLCGINEPISLTYYKGGRKVTETKPKWQIISTHVGRKTFICTALSLGVSPAIIMKWTGHSTYNAMRPYIDIVDSAKREAMKVFDKIAE